jgi:hypothetical protein
MRYVLRRACFALAVVALAACTETARNPVTPATPRAGPRLETTTAAWNWTLSDLDAEFGDRFSWDDTETGLNAAFRYDSYPGEDREFCRDHFKPIDIWWDGGYGIATIHLDPPLLFVGYRDGTFKDRRNLIFRKAVYETVGPGEGEDPAGNVWRFSGRFNALCRGGAREIGPIVFYSHLLVAQDPIDRPVLVRRGTSGSGGCGEDLTQLTYSPYNDGSGSDSGNCPAGGDGSADDGSGTQFQPGDYTGGETVDFGTGMGNGGSSVCGATAVVEYVCIDAWNGEKERWEEWACGYVTSC